MNKLILGAGLFVCCFFVGRYLVQGNSKYTFESIPDQTGKHVVITGANTGLGLATAKHFVNKGAKKLTLCVRSKSKGDEAVSELKELGGKTEVVVELVDLADLESVNSFTKRMTKNDEKIDVLILNAGVMAPPFSRTKQGIELQFGVNHIGHYALTVPLVPLVKRVVVVSSMGAHFVKANDIPFDDIVERKGVLDENGQYSYYNAFMCYAGSKLSNVMFAEGLRQHFPKLEVAVSHPGYTATDLQRHALIFRISNKLGFAQDVAQGSLTQVRAAVDDLTNLTKRHWFSPGGVREWMGNPLCNPTAPQFTDEHVKKLWSLSEEVTGIKG